MRENSERAFHAYGKQMKAVTEFQYLGLLLRWLAGGGRQHSEGAGDLGTVGAGAGAGGGGPESVTKFLYCRDTAGPPLRGGVVGFDGEMESALEGVQGRFHFPVKTHDSAPKRRTCCVTAV